MLQPLGGGSHPNHRRGRAGLDSGVLMHAGFAGRCRCYLASALIPDRMINHRQMSAIPFNPKGLNLPPRWSIIHQLSAGCVFLHFNECASQCWCLLLSGCGICFFPCFFCFVFSNPWCLRFGRILCTNQRKLLYQHCKVHNLACEHRMRKTYPPINLSINQSIIRICIHSSIHPPLGAEATLTINPLSHPFAQ